MITEKLNQSEWKAYFDHVTSQIKMKEAFIEVASLVLGDQIRAEWSQLIGITYNPEDNQFEIALHGLEITPVEIGEEDTYPITVESPVKAHLEDGSTIIYPKGMTIVDGKVKGQGFKYDITLDHSEPVTEIKFDEVAAMLFCVVFGDSMVRWIEGSETSHWFWLLSGKGETLAVFGALSVRCDMREAYRQR